MRAALKERLALGVLMQEKTTTVPDHQGLVPMGGGVSPHKGWAR
jgi:hypothetical protein